MFSPLPVQTTLAAALAAALLFLGGCNSGSPVKAAVKAEKERKPAPEFTLKDSEGRPVKLSDYRGKVVLLNFWATWCGPCKIEIPWFIDFEKRFKDRGFAVVGVSMDEDGWEAVKPYLEEKKINYRVMIGTDELADLYGGVQSLPTSFMLDQQGRIASVHIGLVSKSVYENEIVHLLDVAGKAASGGGVAATVVAGAR
ncbi:MAG: TlpA disulfide reductase family protein [Bryobacteraceae bacterium]|nr:TlpA disulfide reductase family protein [Bryobacteraceae bacterium]